jgi:hypothetical protein
MNPTMDNANQIMNSSGKRSSPQIMDGYIYFPSPETNTISDHGALRVKYSSCPVGPISIMAKTVENKFEAFPIA